MRRLVTPLVSICIFFLCTVASGEDVPNPIFESWKGCGPGSWARYKQGSIVEGQKSETVATYKLVEVRANEVVLDVQVDEPGHPERSHSETRIVPARIEEMCAKTLDVLKPTVDFADVTLGKKGADTVEVGGGKIQTDTIVFTLKTATGNYHSTVWYSAGTPGGLINLEMHTVQDATQKDSTINISNYKMLVDFRKEAIKPPTEAATSSAPSKP